MIEKLDNVTEILAKSRGWFADNPNNPHVAGAKDGATHAKISSEDRREMANWSDLRGKQWRREYQRGQQQIDYYTYPISQAEVDAKFGRAEAHSAFSRVLEKAPKGATKQDIISLLEDSEKRHYETYGETGGKDRNKGYGDGIKNIKEYLIKEKYKHKFQTSDN